MPERVERISNKKYGDCPADDSYIFYGPDQGCPPADKLFLFTGTISLAVEQSGTERVRQSAYGFPVCGESIDWRDPFPNVEPQG